jgi:hypothetical protein
MPKLGCNATEKNKHRDRAQTGGLKMYGNCMYLLHNISFHIHIR